MYTEDIYTAAVAICGEESEFLRLLCTAAEEELTYRLKSDISPGDIEEIFIAAASLLAVSMFKGTSSGADGIKSFSAGEMSVTYFGGEGTVVTEESRVQRTRSFIQPVIEKRTKGPWEITPLGRRDTSLFYWFCPNGVEIDSTERAVVTIAGTDYVIMELKPYRFGWKVSHMEGVLALKEVDCSDGI